MPRKQPGGGLRIGNGHAYAQTAIGRRPPQFLGKRPPLAEESRHPAQIERDLTRPMNGDAWRELTRHLGQHVGPTARSGIQHAKHDVTGGVGKLTIHD
jgi:hypothetical protein